MSATGDSSSDAIRSKAAEAEAVAAAMPSGGEAEAEAAAAAMPSGREAEAEAAAAAMHQQCHQQHNSRSRSNDATKNISASCQADGIGE